VHDREGAHLGRVCRRVVGAAWLLCSVACAHAADVPARFRCAEGGPRDLVATATVVIPSSHRQLRCDTADAKARALIAEELLRAVRSAADRARPDLPPDEVEVTQRRLAETQVTTVTLTSTSAEKRADRPRSGACTSTVRLRAADLGANVERLLRDLGVAERAATAVLHRLCG
jgi:hypothetical protein